MADRGFEDRVIQSLPCSCGHDHDCATVNCSHVIHRPPVSGEPSTDAGRDLWREFRDAIPVIMRENERARDFVAYIPTYLARIEAEARNKA